MFVVGYVFGWTTGSLAAAVEVLREPFAHVGVYGPVRHGGIALAEVTGPSGERLVDLTDSTTQRFLIVCRFHGASTSF